MARKPGGRDNAFKHGGFSQHLVLADEKSEDFEQLLQSLIEEWSPTGALEEDTVFTLAQSIWQKRRVERFYHREATGAQQHTGEHELNYVARFVSLLDRAARVKDAPVIDIPLPELYRKWIEQECPRSKFNDAQSWNQFMKLKIQEIMMEHKRWIMDDRVSLRFKAEKAALLRDLTAKKISVDERIDAGIDKAIKRLAQLKTFKQVMEASASQKSNEQLRISDQRQ